MSEINFDSNSTSDPTTGIFTGIGQTRINLLKEVLEDLCIDLGPTDNTVDYKNYLISNPITFQVPGMDGLSGLGDLTFTGPNNTGLSNGIIAFICVQETGHNYGYTMSEKDLNGYDLHDAHGHRTFGYGLLFHPVSQKYMDTIKPQWTQQELEQLYLYHAASVSKTIDNWARSKGISLNQNQKDAIASACYNFGTGFLKKSICNMIAQNPNDSNIFNVWAHLSDAQGKKYPGLIKRRNAEANWYFGRH